MCFVLVLVLVRKMIGILCRCLLVCMVLVSWKLLMFGMLMFIRVSVKLW